MDDNNKYHKYKVWSARFIYRDLEADYFLIEQKKNNSTLLTAINTNINTANINNNNNVEVLVGSKRSCKKSAKKVNFLNDFDNNNTSVADVKKTVIGEVTKVMPPPTASQTTSTTNKKQKAGDKAKEPKQSQNQKTTTEIDLQKEKQKIEKELEQEGIHKSDMKPLGNTPLAGEVAKARQFLVDSRNALSQLETAGTPSFTVPVIDGNVGSQMRTFEKAIEGLTGQMSQFENRIEALEKAVVQTQANIKEMMSNVTMGAKK